MNTRESLVAAIAADPDADAPRLVLADWLDENGEPERAEFVRAQCDATRPDAHVRAYALLAANWPRWFGPLLTAAGCRLGGYAVPPADWAMLRVAGPGDRRRFVRAIAVFYGFAWSADADLSARRRGSLAPLLDAEPIDTLTASVDRPGDWAAASVPALARVRRLTLHAAAPLVEDVLAAVAAAFDDLHLSGVRSIDLSGLWADADVIGRFAGSPLAARTTDVSLWLDAEAVGRLADAPAGLPWERFAAVGTGWTLWPEAAEAFAALPFRGNVRELGLPNLGLADATPAAVAAADGWDRLERLYAYHTDIGGAGVRAVADAPFAGRLRAVRLYGNPRIGDDPAAVVRLADALDPVRLEELDVRNCGLPPAVTAALRERFGDRAWFGDDE